MGRTTDPFAATAATAATDSNEDEAALVVAAQRDPAAFGPLYARYLRPIYRFCYRRLGNHEAAEDATSHVFMKALAALPTYRDDTFRGWLFTIADRVTTDALRRRRPRADLDAAANLIDAAPGPEEHALATEQRRTVQTLLTSLSPDQRRVVELRLAGLTGPEIARVLGRRGAAVKSTQYRAYARLRQLMGLEADREKIDGET